MSRERRIKPEKPARISAFDYDDEEEVRSLFRKKDPEKERQDAEFRRKSLEVERALNANSRKTQGPPRETIAAGLDMSEEARKASLARAYVPRVTRSRVETEEERLERVEDERMLAIELRKEEEEERLAKKDREDQEWLAAQERSDIFSRAARTPIVGSVLTVQESRLNKRLHERAERDYERQAVPVIEIDEPILPGSIEYRSRETEEAGQTRRTELMQDLALKLDRPYTVVKEGKTTVGRSGYEIYVLPPTAEMPAGKMVFVNDTSGNAAIVIHRLVNPEDLIDQQADWRQFAPRTKNDLKALQAVGLASVIDRFTSADSWTEEMREYLEQQNDPDQGSLNIDQLCNQEMPIASDNYYTRNEIHLLFPSWNLNRLIKEISIVLHEPEMTQRTDQPLTGWYNEKTRTRVNFHYHQSVADRLREKFPPAQERPKNSLALKELTRHLQAEPEIAEYAKEGLQISFPTVYTVIADLIIQHPAWEVNCLGAGPEGTVAVYTAEALTSIKEEIVKYLKQRKIEKADILFPERPLAAEALPPNGAMTKNKIAEKYDIANAGIDQAVRLQLGQGRTITDLGNYFRGPKKFPAWYYYGHTIQDIEPKLTIPYAETGDEIETTLLARLKTSSMVLTRNLIAIAVERNCLTKDLWQEKKDPQNKMPKNYLPREMVVAVEEKIK